MLGRLVAPAPPNRFGGEAPGVTPVFGPARPAATLIGAFRPAPISVAAMTESGGGGPTATSDALAGTQWEIVAVEGQSLVTGDERPVLSFGHDGRMSGTTGVNHLTASYSLTAGYLTFGPLATTRRAGSPELMVQERMVVAALAGMCPYRLSARSLWIDGPMGRVELASTNPAPATAAASRPTEAVSDGTQ